LDAGLIAYQDPFYQVLSLEPNLDSWPAAARSGQALPLSAILRQILEGRAAQSVISYEHYCQIRLLYRERGLSFAQIARELHLDEETVAKWARAKSYTIARTNTPRKSKLDPYRELIQRRLERHSYTATQIFQRLRAEEGYSGGITILTD
jgi:hypothetical protein